MKVNELPERIYIFDNPILDFSKLSQKHNNDDVEYIRKDIVKVLIEAEGDNGYGKGCEYTREQIIEKACEWLKENANDYACIGYAPYYDLAGNERERPFAQMNDSFIKDFKSAMKL